MNMRTKKLRRLFIQIFNEIIMMFKKLLCIITQRFKVFLKNNLLNYRFSYKIKTEYKTKIEKTSERNKQIQDEILIMDKEG